MMDCKLFALLIATCGAFVARSPLPAIAPRRCAARAAPTAAADVAVVLLAGGVGSRMKADRPKQRVARRPRLPPPRSHADVRRFLELAGKPVLYHSLDLFLGLEGVSSLVLVINEQYRGEFAPYAADGRVTFADPGAERQDSVRSGLDACPADAALVCIHDAARPLVTPEEIFKVIGDARDHGAAVLGVPVKATVKESDDGEFVLRTVDRSRLWEVHTPQVIKPALLREGFDKVAKEGLEVTDDVSIIEQLGLPVKLTLGEYTNLKVTTPDDMVVATQILDQRAAAAAN